MGRVNSPFHLKIRDVSCLCRFAVLYFLIAFRFFSRSSLLTCFLYLSIRAAKLVGVVNSDHSIVHFGSSTTFLMAMDVAVVCSADHEQLDEAPNLFDDLHCIGAVCVYLFC